VALADLQRLLAHVYTDDALRREFFAAPEVVAKRFGLSDDELSQVQPLSAGQVEYFAGAVRRKRLRAVARLLPLSHRALGPRFAALFADYASGSAPGRRPRQRQDAVAFAAYVERIARTEPLEPAWAAEQMRYEAAWVAMAEPGRRVLVRRLREPISARAPLAGAERPARARGRGLAIWWRLSPDSRSGHLVLSVPRFGWPSGR
jgi:hypothetical protein